VSEDDAGFVAFLDHIASRLFNTLKPTPKSDLVATFGSNLAEGYLRQAAQMPAAVVRKMTADDPVYTLTIQGWLRTSHQFVNFCDEQVIHRQRIDISRADRYSGQWNCGVLNPKQLQIGSISSCETMAAGRARAPWNDT
jgi:hypothetical protein